MHRQPVNRQHEGKSQWKQKPQVSFIAQFDADNETDEDSNEEQSELSSSGENQDFHHPVQ